MTDISYHKVDAQRMPAPQGCPIDHDFSPYHERYIADPYRWLNEKREEEPVFYSDDLGYVVVTRMEDVDYVFRNPDLFTSTNVQDPVFPICDEAARILAADDYNPVAVMSNREQPDHTRIRKHTQACFSPRRISLLEPVIRQRAADLIDTMLAQGSPAEWVAAVGNPLPAETIFRLIGFDPADDKQLKDWTNDRLEFTWGKSDKDYQIRVATNLLSYWRHVAAFVEMRKANPADDMTSELLAAHAEHPEEITFNEVQSVVYGLSFAGHEIVRNLISNSLLCLLSEREHWNKLLADPELIPKAVEEVLRINSAQTSWRRLTTRDTTLGGINIPKGTPIFMSLAAANHDPRSFEEPEVFDISRRNAARHIAFGRGPHICLGRILAKLELKTVLELVVEKVPSIRLVEDQQLEYPSNFSFRGPQNAAGGLGVASVWFCVDSTSTGRLRRTS
ncbi:MAG: cytochrome P450 [Pseudomonadota bacterium]